MPKTPTPPISPTVADVFARFLEKLRTERITDETTIERLQVALDDQKLDADSLRSALFPPQPTQL
jgi:hypothetical protein